MKWDISPCILSNVFVVFDPLVQFDSAAELLLKAPKSIPDLNLPEKKNKTKIYVASETL